jgi:dynein heavy chain, axonemal
MVTEIRSLFVMALAWSFGAALTGQGRTILSSWISDLFS